MPVRFDDIPCIAGVHEFWLSAGGSCGHGGLGGWTSTRASWTRTSAGANWGVKVLTLNEAKEQAKTMKDVQKEEKKSREDQKLMSKFVEALEGKGGSCTKKQLQTTLGWWLPRFNRTLDLLLEGGAVEVVLGTTTAGKGAQRQAEFVRKRIIGS